MAAPISGNTRVNIYGPGYLDSNQYQTPVYVKFGTIAGQVMDKAEVSEISFNDDAYHEELKINTNLLHEAELHDDPIKDGTSLDKYIQVLIPDISKEFMFNLQDPSNFGGPVYLEVGEKVPIRIISHEEGGQMYNQEDTDYIEAAYQASSTEEFYFYRPPVITKVEPLSGLVTGGTQITITGAWFDQKPEYGVFPFCKIGDTIVRAKFVQTTRIICVS
jgi:hypothetical protein